MQPSLTQGRLCIALAAVLWSLSGAFTKILTNVMVEEYGYPEVAPLQIAFYRVFFAGVVLAPILRPADLTWRPQMVPMALCFAAMNALFVTALAEGTAANAVLLQYTAPMWMYLASVFWLGEFADRRSTIALGIGLTGIAVIIVGGWDGGELSTIAICPWQRRDLCRRAHFLAAVATRIAALADSLESTLRRTDPATPGLALPLANLGAAHRLVSFRQHPDGFVLLAGHLRFARRESPRSGSPHITGAASEPVVGLPGLVEDRNA
jgi:drug/metabolite transporter (DMT)-like permease